MTKETYKKVKWLDFDNLELYRKIEFIVLVGCNFCKNSTCIRDMDGQIMLICIKNQVVCGENCICKDYDDKYKDKTREQILRDITNDKIIFSFK